MTCSTQGSQHNQQSNSMSTLKIVSEGESCRGQNTFSLPRVVPKFLLLGVMLIGAYGLNLPEVGKLLVPSIPVKLSHMDILVEIWYNFQLDMYHFPFPAFYSYKKKTKMYNTNRRYSGEIMVTKISSTVYWISRQWELSRETPWDLCLYFL